MKLETQLLSAKLPSYTEPDGIAQRHSLLPHSGKQQVIRKAVFCAVTCVWSRIKSNFLFTLPLTLPVYFEQITRCLSASLFRVGHSGQVSTVQHSGCFGRGVTSLIFRDVNISKQHPQLSIYSTSCWIKEVVMRSPISFDTTRPSVECQM